MKERNASKAPARPEDAKILVRLAVTPPRPVRCSIDGRQDPVAARAESSLAGLPEDLLRRFQAAVRHTHSRINAVVLELPAEHLEELKSHLRKRKISFEEVQPVYPQPAFRV